MYIYIHKYIYIYTYVYIYTHTHSVPNLQLELNLEHGVQRAFYRFNECAASQNIHIDTYKAVKCRALVEAVKLAALKR